MKTSQRSAFVVSWAQTEVDGLTGASLGEINIGTTWRWSGEAMRVGAPRDIYLLENALGSEDLRRRAAARTRIATGTGRAPMALADDDDEQIFRTGFELTDGLEKYRAVVLGASDASRPMLMFTDKMPPRDAELWVIERFVGQVAQSDPSVPASGVICFVPGTKIATPDGPKLVQDLVADDLICTKDNGVQPVRWIGSRRVTGARLRAIPHLRPIKIRADIFGQGEPDEDLIVSPDHRILVKGAMARALFNTPEVLVSARDLVNDRSILFDHSLREVSYVHLMMEQHQILWANGIECDSFHPAGTPLDQIAPPQRQDLLERFPAIAQDPSDYGGYARRNLSAPEAAILAYDGHLKPV